MDARDREAPAGTGAGTSARGHAQREKSSTKKRRRRRTDAEIQEFDDAVRSILEPVQPATVRQVYYRAVVAGLVDKDKRGRRWVGESLARSRWNGAVPWEWIVDKTRALLAPEVWRDADSGLAAFSETYRRDLWRTQPAWVEVWVESDSLAGTLVDVTWRLGVPLFSGRGFSSLSALRSAAEQIDQRAREREQPTTVLYVGDLDPAGWEAGRSAERELVEHLDDLLAPGDPEEQKLLVEEARQLGEPIPRDFLKFHRLAVNPDQVEEYGLPDEGAPPARKGPGSVSWWEDDAPGLDYTVEAEAFEPEDLRQLVRLAILDGADVEALERAREVEDLERETLRQVAEAGFSVLERYSDGGGAP